MIELSDKFGLSIGIATGVCLMRRHDCPPRCQGLLERGISAVRVGNPAKIREDLRWASLEGRAEASTRGKQAVTVRAESEELRAAADAGKAARPPMGAAEVRELRAESHKKWKLADMLMEDALRNALEGAQVVLCTCAGAASPTLKPHSFKVVLVDEATQVGGSHAMPSPHPRGGVPHPSEKKSPMLPAWVAISIRVVTG